MMEFFPLDIVKASILGILVTGIMYASFLPKDKRNKERVPPSAGVKLFSIFLVLFFISLPFIEAYINQTTAKKNLIHFSNGESFICEGGDFNKYSVSSKNGWSRDKNYFTKDSLMIRADKCEER